MLIYNQNQTIPPPATRYQTAHYAQSPIPTLIVDPPFPPRLQKYNKYFTQPNRNQIHQNTHPYPAPNEPIHALHQFLKQPSKYLNRIYHESTSSQVRHIVEGLSKDNRRIVEGFSASHNTYVIPISTPKRTYFILNPLTLTQQILMLKIYAPSRSPQQIVKHCPTDFYRAQLKILHQSTD